MENLIRFGVDFIVRFQAMGVWLAVPMKFFSFLGSEEFFLFVLPLVYWCIDAALGLRIGLILLIGNNVNDIFKMAMHGPRPYWVSANVKGMASETSFGVPSGHSQVAFGVWGVVADRIGRTWAWILAGTVILLIGLSRMYLGVHFPHDVLLGWALGALTLWIFLGVWKPVAARLEKMNLGGQVAAAFIGSLVMIVLPAVIVFLSRDFQVPAEWIANAVRDGGAAPDPLTLAGAFTAAGTFFGLGAGAAWIRSRGGFQASGPLGKRALRYLVGFLGVAVFYFGLKLVLPGGDAVVGLVFRYVRYTLVGAWISAGAPWVFSRLQIG
jgi:membrane-associated phospholipid phosphatase